MERPIRADRAPSADSSRASGIAYPALMSGRPSSMSEAPDLPTVLAEVSGPVTVVPLLLGAGFHVHVDIATAVDARVATGQPTATAPTLGPDPAITGLLLDRLRDVELTGTMRSSSPSPAPATCGPGCRPIQPHPWSRPRCADASASGIWAAQADRSSGSSPRRGTKLMVPRCAKQASQRKVPPAER